MYNVHTIQGFHQVWYQGGMKATVSGVLEDLKFKNSEGSNKTETATWAVHSAH